MPTALDRFLSGSPPPTNNTYSAHDPSAGFNFMTNPNVGQSAASPPPLQYLTVGAGSYRVLTVSYPKPTLKIPKARPVITAVVRIPPGTDQIAVLSAALKGGDISLLTSAGVTIVAYRTTLETFTNLSLLDGFPASTDGSTVLLISASCAPTDYRGA